MENVVPSPGFDCRLMVPLCPLVTMSYAKLSPKPVPCPVGLVVKKGWKILSRMDSGIPLPLSWTLIRI